MATRGALAGRSLLREWGAGIVGPTRHARARSMIRYIPPDLAAAATPALLAEARRAGAPELTCTQRLEGLDLTSGSAVRATPAANDDACCQLVHQR